MVYLSHYEEYPIYEPAEGGYYYAGAELTFSTKLSLRQAKRDLKAMAAELLEKGYTESANWHPETFDMLPGKRYSYKSQYIGEGDFWVIERRPGCFTKGYKPYC